MRFLTIEEFEEIKLYEVDDVTYRRIEKAFVDKLGEKLGKKILAKYVEKRLKELTLQSYVDIMSILNIF